MRLLSAISVCALLFLSLASFAQAPDEKVLPDKNGILEGGNVYSNPILRMKMILPGTWNLFDRMMYSSREEKQREKEAVEQARATCLGPLCDHGEIDVALRSFDMQSLRYTIYLVAYPLSQEDQNRQRHPLKGFAEIMTVGSVRDKQWIAEGALTPIELDHRPAYRLIMHDAKTPTAKAFAYVADSNGRVFILLGVAISESEKLQAAIENMQFSQSPTASTMSGNVVPAKLVEKIQPTYPQEAREKKIEGTAALNVVIKKDGSVAVSDVREGNPLLVPAAIDAVQHWRYIPFLVNGEPVDMRTTIRVVFALTQKSH